MAFRTEDDFSCVEFHIQLVENAMLAEVIMEISSVHEIQNETEFVRRVEGVRHADDKRAINLWAKNFCDKIVDQQHRKKGAYLDITIKCQNPDRFLGDSFLEANAYHIKYTAT